jgi:hypothetical protein
MERLTILQDALINTGNEPVVTEFDGSTEWMVVERAWNRALRYLIPAHPWNFANTTAALAGLLAESPHPTLDKAFALPADCLWVEMAWLDGRPLGEFEILDQKFCSRYDTDLRIKYVRLPLPTQFPPGFVEVLTMKIEEYIYRGLNEDLTAAQNRAKEVKIELDLLRSSLDRQEPARAVLRSRTAARRRGYGVLSPLLRPPYDGVG